MDMKENKNFKKQNKRIGIKIGGVVVALATLITGTFKACDAKRKSENVEKPKRGVEDIINKTPDKGHDIILKPRPTDSDRNPEIITPNPDDEIHVTIEPTPSEDIEPVVSADDINKDNEGKKPGRPNGGSHNNPPATPSASVPPETVPTDKPGTIVDPTPSPSDDDINKDNEKPGSLVRPTPVPTETPVVTPSPTPTPVATPRPTETPVVTPSPIPTPTPTSKPDRPGHGGDDRPTHYHSYGAWYSLNDDLEERKCSCGATETRGHSYSDVKTTYESTNDGSHYKVTTSTCSTCGHKKVEKDLGPCSYGKLEYNDDYEYKTCSDCGYELKVKDHSLSTKTDYVYYENDTHKVITKTTCSTCDYSKTSEEILDCTYGDLQWDDTKEFKVCEACDHEKTIGKHNLGSAKPNAVGIVTYPCTNDGCGYEGEHKHIPGEKDITYSDDQCHDIIIRCEECGEIISTDSVSHNYVDTGEWSTTTKKVKCTGCGDEKSVDLTPEEIEEIIKDLLGETTDNTVSYVYNHSLVRSRKRY